MTTKNSNNIQLRRLNLDDLDELYAIEQAAFSHPWSRNAYQTDLANQNDAYYLGCFVEGKLVAYAGFWLIIDEGHITNVATAPNYRRQGYGELLLRYLMLKCLSLGGQWMTLEVRSQNTAACALYRKLGFSAVGLRRNYYDNPRDDAIIMWCRINENQNEE